MMTITQSQIRVAKPEDATRVLRVASRFTLVAPLMALVGFALILPLAHMLLQSFKSPTGEWTTDVYRNVATASVYRSAMVETIVLSATVTGVSLFLGFLMAYRMMNRWARFAPFLLGLLLLSFWTGLLIRTFSWMIILGKNGVVASLADVVGISQLPQMLYNRNGAIVGMVNIMLPYMALVLYSTMQRVDERTMLAAASLGARPSVAFWRVYVPATLPGIAAGCLLVFVITIGFYITPQLLGGPQTTMVSQMVAKVVQELLDFKLAGALSLLMLVVTLVLLAIYNKLFSIRNLGGGL